MKKEILRNKRINPEWNYEKRMILQQFYSSLKSSELTREEVKKMLALRIDVLFNL